MIANERDVLASVDYPFITGLQYAFQDEKEVRGSCALAADAGSGPLRCGALSAQASAAHVLAWQQLAHTRHVSHSHDARTPR